MIRRHKALRARWSDGLGDIAIDYQTIDDGRLLNSALCSKVVRIDDATPSGYSWGPSLAEELEARGYDLTTLKFSIQKKAT